MVTAYSPLARGKVPEDETLRAIGEAHGKTAGQVALRWLLDKPNVATIPKASSHERRVENFEVFDFELTDAERAQIEALPKDEPRDRPALGARLGRLIRPAPGSHGRPPMQDRGREPLSSASISRGASRTSP